MIRTGWLALATALVAGIGAGEARAAEAERDAGDVTLTDEAPSGLVTPPREADLVAPTFDPILLVRASFIQTFEDQKVVEREDGTELELDSTRQDTSRFGHRRGFVLEDVELGLRGRFDEQGFYYKAKFDLVPREKDGNRSSDYLDDAFFGWNRYTVFDARVGRMKIPFSRANLKRTGDRLLVYAPTLDTLVPKRQLGLMLSGGDPAGIARLSAGAFNSVKDATQQMKSFDQLLYVARAELRAGRLLDRLGVDLPWLEWDVAANVAYVEEHFDPKSEHRWFGLDTRLRTGPVTTEAEWVVKDWRSGSVVDGVEGSFRGWGWYVDVTWHAIPGLLDLAGRVESSDGDDLVRGFDPSFTIDDLSRQKKRWIWASASVHLSERSRCTANYIHREELEGFSLSNDVVLGMCQYDL